MDLSMFIPVTTSGINTSNAYIFPHTHKAFKVIVLRSSSARTGMEETD